MLDLTFFIILITFIIIIYLINKNKDNKDKKLNTKIHIFDIVSIVFILLFVFYTYKYGTECGIITSIFLWAFFVCTTTIPEAGLLITIPLKHFFNIDLNISQIFISIIASLILIILYNFEYNYIKLTKIGKIFIQLIKKHIYSIFIVSIITSIIGSYILNEIIELFFINNFNNINNLIPYIIIFILLNFYYFYLFFINKIKI